MHCTTKELLQDFVNYAKDYGVRHHLNEVTIGQFIHRMCPGIDVRQRRVTEKHRNAYGTVVDRYVRKRCYMFPALDVCRNQWDLELGEEVWPPIMKALPINPYPESDDGVM